MIRSRHSIKNRQQSMLNRAAAEIKAEIEIDRDDSTSQK
jgi:hypothetical protein